MKCALLACSVVIAALIAAPIASTASAQEAGAASERASGRAKKAKRAKRAKPAKRAKDEPNAAAEPKPSEAEAAVPSGEGVAPKTDAPANASASSALGGAEEQVRKEGDTEVKTVEFTGLDIEGQLKTPQLLYFLTRLRAEFDRPRLPHRSFMPELSRSSGEKALR